MLNRLRFIYQLTGADVLLEWLLIDNTGRVKFLTVKNYLWQSREIKFPDLGNLSSLSSDFTRGWQWFYLARLGA